jgi:hypothetical protein
MFTDECGTEIALLSQLDLSQRLSERSVTIVVFDLVRINNAPVHWSLDEPPIAAFRLIFTF